MQHEYGSATDFKGFEALHGALLNIGDQLLCSDVHMEVEQMYDELRSSFEMFRRNINKLTLDQARKSHASAANDFA